MQHIKAILVDEELRIVYPDKQGKKGVFSINISFFVGKDDEEDFFSNIYISPETGELVIKKLRMDRYSNEKQSLVTVETRDAGISQEIIDAISRASLLVTEPHKGKQEVFDDETPVEVAVRRKIDFEELREEKSKEKGSRRRFREFAIYSGILIIVFFAFTSIWLWAHVSSDSHDSYDSLSYIQPPSGHEEIEPLQHEKIEHLLDKAVHTKATSQIKEKGDEPLPEASVKIKPTEAHNQ